LRDGRLREIALESMQGLISIPSLHAAMAVLLVYTARGIRFVLPASLALNLAMLASTPIEGGHYLVDVFAGCALALGLIGLGLQRKPRPAAHPQIWNLQ
jgi:membrane-associated phospholipid phosphatase